MTYAEEEFFAAYDGLTQIITEEQFAALEHKFIRSYSADFEYALGEKIIFIKCNDQELLIEMMLYDHKLKRVTETFAYRFTLCKVYYEFLGHFTKIMFKESVFCEQRYGIQQVDRYTIKSLEEDMKRLAEGANPYQWQ